MNNTEFLSLVNGLDHTKLGRIYPIIVTHMIKHVATVKSKDKDAALLDIILDFAKKRKLDIDLVIDAMNDDFYLREAVMRDCLMRGIRPQQLSAGSNLTDDW